MPVDLHQILDGKWADGSRPKDLFAAHVGPAPKAYLGAIVAGLGSDKARVRNGCAELASLLSAAEPALLLPHVARFAANLAAKEPVLRWEAACTLGNLAAVDRAGTTRGSVDGLADCLAHESVVLGGHAARALAKMALAFPDLAPRILARLVASEPHFAGSRVGYLIEAMSAFAGDPRLAAKARAFVEPFAVSPINPVASKAKKTLRALARGK